MVFLIFYINNSFGEPSRFAVSMFCAKFGVEDDRNAPKIALHIQTDYYVMGISQGEEDLSIRYDWAPEVTRYGYVVDENVPFETVDEIVIQLVNALPKFVSILVDGFANWSFKENISLFN